MIEEVDVVDVVEESMKLEKKRVCPPGIHCGNTRQRISLSLSSLTVLSD